MVDGVEVIVVFGGILIGFINKGDFFVFFMC